MTTSLNLPPFIDATKPLNMATCRSCGQTVYWATTLKGKKAPLNTDGTSHFGSCPQSKSWSKGGKR